jgi:methylphosphotriester-DNA--protein-cysteine methyltransferase
LPAEAQGNVIGNKSSHVFHKPGCTNGAKILEKNRVLFDTEAEAEKAGFRPGKDCHRAQ